MAPPVVQLSFSGGKQLKATALVLREQGRSLQREVGGAIKAEGQPTLDSLRASARSATIRGVPTKSLHRFTHRTRQKHLRERMAQATVLEVKTGQDEARVSFHTVGARMGNAKVVPRYVDLGKPFRHPIMGDRESWATSVGEPWFFPPIKKHLPKFRERIIAVLDDVAAKVEAS